MSLGTSLFPFLHLVPRNFLSRVMGKLAHSRFIPRFLHRKVIEWFGNHYQVDLNEAAESQMHAYRTFGDFFTRALKPNSRPTSEGIIFPCDGILGPSGNVEAGRLIQVKGMDYTLNDLIPEQNISNLFANGSYATIYLSPRHYHRVHSPVTGEIRSTHHFPGDLWPVNRTAVERIPRLFCRNDRILTLIEDKDVSLGVLFVGATIVGHIHLSYDRYRPNVVIKKGDELGYFTLGSTIILLSSRHEKLAATPEIDGKVGQTLWEVSNTLA